MAHEIDHPDKVLPRSDAAKVFWSQYNRSRREFMDKVQRRKFKELYKAYRAFFEVKDADQKSNLALPLIASHVDSFVARLAGARPIIEVLPREPGDIDRARKHNDLLDYQWDALGMLLHFLMLAKTAMIHGIGWGKVTWRREIRSRMVQKRLDVQSDALGIDLDAFRDLMGRVLGGITGPRMEDTVVWDNPYFQVLEPDSIYPDPEGYSIDSCQYLIERQEADLPYLEAVDKKSGGDVEFVPGALRKLRKLMKDGNLLARGEGQTTVAEEAANTFGGTRSTSQGSDPTRQQFHLLEKWTDGRVQWMIEEAPQLDLIRDEPHATGMKPYVRYTPDPLPNELIGTSVTERLLAINMHMNTTVNAINDATLATINAILLVPRTSLTNPQHLRDRSRGWAWADPQNPPQYLTPPELKQGGYRYLAELRQVAEEIGGTRTFRGLGGDGDTTATEADLLARASGTKAGMMLQVMNEQPLKRTGRLMVKLNELNIDKSREVRILGADFDAQGRRSVSFDTVSPADLAQRGGVEMDVTIDVASNDPDTRQWKMRRAGEQFRTMAEVAKFLPEFRPLVRQHGVELARLTDIPNPEQLMEQGVAELQQQQQLAQLQGSLAQGQNVGNEGQQIAADQGEQVVF